MKQIQLILILTLIVLDVSFSQPKLSIDKPIVDLGTIYSGMKKQGKLVLKNIGNDTLQIFSGTAFLRLYDCKTTQKFSSSIRIRCTRSGIQF